MYSLLRNEPLRRQFVADARTLLTTQALTLLPALLITQFFYHWKSFLLEFGGFLVTWFVIDFLATTVRDFGARGRAHHPAGRSNRP
jgi:asparagine N-glycosylation enzyme membrane subunit Stt3